VMVNSFLTPKWIPKTSPTRSMPRYTTYYVEQSLPADIQSTYDKYQELIKTYQRTNDKRLLPRIEKLYNQLKETKYFKFDESKGTIDVNALEKITKRLDYLNQLLENYNKETNPAKRKQYEDEIAKINKELGGVLREPTKAERLRAATKYLQENPEFKRELISTGLFQSYLASVVTGNDDIYTQAYNKKFGEYIKLTEEIQAGRVTPEQASAKLDELIRTNPSIRRLEGVQKYINTKKTLEQFNNMSELNKLKYIYRDAYKGDFQFTDTYILPAFDNQEQRDKFLTDLNSGVILIQKWLDKGLDFHDVEASLGMVLGHADYNKINEKIRQYMRAKKNGNTAQAVEYYDEAVALAVQLRLKQEPGIPAVLEGLSTPLGQLAITILSAMAVPLAIGGIGGYLAGISPKAALAFNVGAGAVGAYSVGTEVGEIYKQIEGGDVSGGAYRLGLLGLSFGIAPHYYNKSFYRGLVKGYQKRVISFIDDDVTRAKYDSLFKAINQSSKTPTGTRTTIALQDVDNLTPGQVEAWTRFLNSPDSKGFKIVIGGSASQESFLAAARRVHDIDILVGQGRGRFGIGRTSRVNELTSLLKKYGIDTSKTDIHDLGTTGALISPMSGTVKEPIRTVDGPFEYQMSIQEQALRKGGSWADLQHPGRGKDIRDFLRIFKEQINYLEKSGEVSPKRITELKTLYSNLNKWAPKLKGKFLYDPVSSYYDAHPNKAPIRPLTWIEKNIIRRISTPPAFTMEAPFSPTLAPKPSKLNIPKTVKGWFTKETFIKESFIPTTGAKKTTGVQLSNFFEPYTGKATKFTPTKEYPFPLYPTEYPSGYSLAVRGAFTPKIYPTPSTKYPTLPTIPKIKYPTSTPKLTFPKGTYIPSYPKEQPELKLPTTIQYPKGKPRKVYTPTTYKFKPMFKITPIPSVHKAYAGPPYKKTKPKRRARKRKPLEEEGRYIGGYAPQVKVDATKKHKARWETITSKHSLPLEQARGLGAKYADETVSRSFRVVKSKKPMKPNPRLDFEWSRRQHKFRPKIIKGKKRTIPPYIEKTDYAIDSPGELKGITVKGLKALERKREIGYISFKSSRKPIPNQKTSKPNNNLLKEFKPHVVGVKKGLK